MVRVHASPLSGHPERSAAKSKGENNRSLPFDKLRASGECGRQRLPSMKLRSKFAIATALATLLPIGLLTAVSRVAVSNEYVAQFHRVFDDSESEALKQFVVMGREVEEALAHMASVSDANIGPLLVALSHGTLDQDTANQLSDVVPTVMRALDFDVLELTDEKGVVLAAGHLVGHSGQVDTELRERFRRFGSRAHLVEEPMAGSNTPVLVLESARLVETNFAGRKVRLFVCGGRRLDAHLLNRLALSARLCSPHAEARCTAHGAGEVARVVDLPSGTVAAQLVLLQRVVGLQNSLAWIGYAAISLGGVGVLFAILLSSFVAGLIARPLSELSEKARAVAQGQLEGTLPVRSRDEVGQLSAAFNDMVAHLKTARDELGRAERIAAWREMAQRIAHEIKNPLTPIQLAIETLQRAFQSPRRAEVFDDLFVDSTKAIAEEVNRLKNIVSEFSQFARLPAPRLGAVDLNELVRSTIALYAESASIECGLDDQAVAIWADRDQVVQVIINLLENARDAIATVQGGKIKIVTAREGGVVVLRIQDNGGGMNAEVRRNIFTPYFTTKKKGTGLGLAIVERIVTDHGGKISVDSEVNLSTTFTITWPIVLVSTDASK